MIGKAPTPMHIERQLAVWRVALASVSLLAVWLDPTEPRRVSPQVTSILGAYVFYALVVAAATLRAEAPPRYRLAGYFIDFATAFVAVFLSAGVASPLFPLVVFVLFVLFSAARRWERSITLWATGGVLASFLLLGGLADMSDDGRLELNDLLMRGAVLIMIAAFLMSFVTADARIRTRMERLATPPGVEVQAVDQLLCQLLEWSIGVTGCARAVLVWEDTEEPWLHSVEWRAGSCRHTRESPQSMTPLVVPEIAEVSFLCRHAAVPDAVVLYVSTAGVGRRRGAAMHPLLQARFSMDAALSLVFRREYVKGRLFLLDKRNLTIDDLILGEIVAGHVVDRLNHFHLQQHLAEASVLDERLRLARDLHDSAFHALTGVGLELERLLQLGSLEGAEAKEGIREIRDALVDAQCGMRELIDGLRLAPEPASDLRLETRIESLAERIGRQWGIKIRCSIADCDRVPRAVVDEICLMAHEALVNVGRHSGATTASVSVAASDNRVTLVVADDGRGFGFTGRYDHETLAARHVGPWSLQQRAAALGGRIAIESGSVPTVLEIQVPLGTEGEARP